MKKFILNIKSILFIIIPLFVFSHSLQGQWCNVVNDDFCPGNFFQNGDFEVISGDPNLVIDQDIGLATGWSQLWQDNSLADLHCNGGTSSTGATPNPNTHVYAGIWIENRPSPVNDNTYREGMYNYLDIPIAQSSGNYSFDFKIANANIAASGSVEIGIYGVYNPTQVIANTPVGSSNNPWNVDLWQSVDPAVKVVLLGVITTPSGFTNTWVNENISFDSSILPTNGITHIMVTAYDQATPPEYRKIYVNFDEFCLQELVDEDICSETNAVAIPDQESPFCCFDLQLTNGNAQLFTDIKITPVSNLKFDNVVIDPSWGYSTNNDTEIQINPTAYVPTGTFSPVSLCIKDYDTAPQQIQIEWIGINGESCLDTITLECNKCMNIIYDTLACDPAGFRFDFDFTNISDFNMEQLEVISLIPNSTTVTPIILSIPSVTPGQTSTGHTFYFTPPAGTNYLSFQIKASSNDGCCQCISDFVELVVPECPTECDEPCELKSYTVNSEPGDEYCCHSIDITTECDSTFKCIELEVLTGAYFGTASAGSQWSIMNLSPTIKRWCPRSIFTGSDYIPSGTTSGKINYCLKGFSSIPQTVVMRWIGNNGDTICTDTIVSECEPPPPGDCIIILDDTIKCVPPGGFAYCFSVQNVGMFTGNYVRIDRMHSKPGGAVFTPALVDTMVNLPINSTVVMPPINITNAMSGDTVCFVISVYDTIAIDPNNPNDPQSYNNCCHTDTLCILLPPCEPSIGCDEPCENKSYELIPTSELEDCCYDLVMDIDCDSTFASIELEVLNGGFFRSASTIPGWQMMNLSTNQKVWKPRSLITGSDYIPSGIHQDRISFCLSSGPQVVVMKWLDLNGQIVCTDSIEVDCPVVPGDCIVVLNDTIICDTSGHYSYCFDIENVGNFTGQYIKVHNLHSNPSGGVFTPSSIDTMIHFPIGTTVTMPCITLDGMAAGEEFCFVVSVYDSIKMEGYNNCCHSDTICVVLPPCGNSDVCSEVSISTQPASDIDGDCCHTLSINNNYQANYFVGVRVFGLNPGMTLGFVANAVDWNMTPIAGGGYELIYNVFGGIPLGSSVVGDFCLGNFSSSTQTIEVQWLKDTDVVGLLEVVCCVGIETHCDFIPDYPCMQIVEQQVYCDDTTQEGWFDFTLINNTDQGNTSPGFDVHMITVDVISAPASAVLGPLTFDYSTTPILIGANGNLDKIKITGVNAGDQICLRITGHNVNGKLKKCCTGDEVVCFTMPCDAVATTNLAVDQYRVYPSPVKDVLVIEAISKSTDINIALYDINGRLVYEQVRRAIDDSNIDMSMFTDGIYMLRLTSDQGQEVHKIIKSK